MKSRVPKQPKFAEIVRSSSDVRTAFDSLPMHRLWWRVVLALHGKPTNVSLQTTESGGTLAKGFRFYGQLYTCLAVAMLVAAFAALFSDLSNAVFWSSSLLASAVYLAITCQLAFHGGRAYEKNEVTASTVLLAFFFAITTYLCFFIGCVFAVAQAAYPEHSAVTFVSTIALLLFGVGSYLIEILFLLFHSRAVAPQKQS